MSDFFSVFWDHLRFKKKSSGTFVLVDMIVLFADEKVGHDQKVFRISSSSTINQDTAPWQCVGVQGGYTRAGTGLIKWCYLDIHCFVSLRMHVRLRARQFIRTFFFVFGVRAASAWSKNSGRWAACIAGLNGSCIFLCIPTGWPRSSSRTGCSRFSRSGPLCLFF